MKSHCEEPRRKACYQSPIKQLKEPGMRVELKVLHTKFSDVDGGDVFMVGDDLFIALEKRIETKSGDKINAVDVEDGSLHRFSGDQAVHIFPTATLRVEEPEEDDDDDDDDD